MTTSFNWKGEKYGSDCCGQSLVFIFTQSVCLSSSILGVYQIIATFQYRKDLRKRAMQTKQILLLKWRKQLEGVNISVFWTKKTSSVFPRRLSHTCAYHCCPFHNCSTGPTEAPRIFLESLRPQHSVLNFWRPPSKIPPSNLISTQSLGLKLAHFPRVLSLVSLALHSFIRLGSWQVMQEQGRRHHTK